MSCRCRLLAPNRPAGMSALWSLLGAKRTWLGHGGIDAFDPIRTFIETFIPIFGMRSLDGSHQGIRQCY